MLGVLTYTDPRKTALSEERERALRTKHEHLIELLKREGFDVLDVNLELNLYSRLESGGNFGIDSKRLAFEAGKIVAGADVSGIIMGLWHWTESNLITSTLRVIGDKPVMLYSDDDPAWAGTTCISSVGASLWETALQPRGNRPNHYRLKGEPEELVSWARAMEAVHKLKRGTVLVFGAPYTLGMEHLMDDIPKLKHIVDDVIMLDQYLLVSRAEKLLESDRVEKFLKRLTEHSEIKYDDKMVTPESIRREIALYLASKDWITELSADMDIIAVSVKCQPELSEIYGVVGCFIPAFLPLTADLEGEKLAVSTTCEGDLKGTISSALLEKLSGVPALFGDIKYVDDEVIMVANCGASSVYYANLSDQLEDNLKKVTFQAQCQGRSGAAVTYRTPASKFTVARLVRIKGEHVVQFFCTESIEFTGELESKLRWGRMWPHTLLKNPMNSKSFLQIVGANHLSMVPGYMLRELKYAIAELGLKGLDLSNQSEVETMLEIRV